MTYISTPQKCFQPMKRTIRRNAHYKHHLQAHHENAPRVIWKVVRTSAIMHMRPQRQLRLVPKENTNNNSTVFLFTNSGQRFSRTKHDYETIHIQIVLVSYACKSSHCQTRTKMDCFECENKKRLSRMVIMDTHVKVDEKGNHQQIR